MVILQILYSFQYHTQPVGLCCIPQLPSNTYWNYQIDKSKKQQKGTGYKIKVILGTVFTVIITVLFVSAMDIMLGEIGEYPMANYPSSIENITYGQAFGIACENVNWSGVNESASEDGNSYIQMDGKCMYGGEKHKIKVQFQYHFETSIDSVDETTPFEISFVGLDNDIEVYKSDMEDIYLFYV